MEAEASEEQEVSARLDRPNSRSVTHAPFPVNTNPPVRDLESGLPSHLERLVQIWGEPHVGSKPDPPLISLVSRMALARVARAGLALFPYISPRGHVSHPHFARMPLVAFLVNSRPVLPTSGS